MDIYLDGRTDVTVHAGSAQAVDLDPWDEENALVEPDDEAGADSGVYADDARIASDVTGYYFTFPDDHPLRDFFVRLEGSRSDTWEAMSAVHPDWQWQYSGKEFVEDGRDLMPSCETGTPLL